MESPVNPAIEAFYKAFPIFNNVTVNIDNVVYSKQTNRPLEILNAAKALIKEKELPLVATYSPVFTSLYIQVI